MKTEYYFYKGFVSGLVVILSWSVLGHLFTDVSNIITVMVGLLIFAVTYIVFDFFVYLIKKKKTLKK